MVGDAYELDNVRHFTGNDNIHFKLDRDIDLTDYLAVGLSVKNLNSVLAEKGITGGVYVGGMIGSSAEAKSHLQNYGYLKASQMFVAPATADYKLEVWGAQGESGGGHYCC
ncbi:MAG: hypothetical protein LBP35_03585 [Candidatus Ancillula trichonymphae]|nr:hypothetical protein [Candidatus Ancillula trichonymphae]